MTQREEASVGPCCGKQTERTRLGSWSIVTLFALLKKTPLGWGREGLSVSVSAFSAGMKAQLSACVNQASGQHRTFLHLASF